MKITDEMSFIISKTARKENFLIPASNDQNAKDFIEFYRAGNFDHIEFEKNGGDVRVTLALCALENRSWLDVARDPVFKKDGWRGGSLALWKLYVQNRKESFQNAVLLPGTLYLDDDMKQWVPSAHHHPVISLIWRMRGSETRISMKPSTILGLVPSTEFGNTKTHIVLISKFEEVKT